MSGAREVWVESLEITDVRNLRDVRLDLEPGLNVFVGRNAQGKTTVLETVALLARGRSFRTDDVRGLIRRGATRLHTRGATRHGETDRRTRLEVEVSGQQRSLRVDGREVTPGGYQGRLEVVVYATDRLRVVRGTPRDRRQFLDRAAGALWPAYRHAGRQYERVLQQRNASLECGGRDLEAWDEGFLEAGSQLRHRRALYGARLGSALERAFRPEGERYELRLPSALAPGGLAEHRDLLRHEMEASRRAERAAGRSLIGPHRDAVGLMIGGEEAADSASSGQVRSLLLALCTAMLEVYQAERGTAAVALLDDLDSELDEERASRLCGEVAGRGQVLVTSAHPGWARGLGNMGRVFRVEGGEVTAA